ncbi:MAG: Ig-like domain-containing protein, partial [Paludibacteraceae bacterium]
MKKLTLLLAAAMLSSMSFATWQRVKTVEELLEGGTMIIGYEATAKSGVIVPMRTEGTATASAAGYMYSGTTAESSTSTTVDMSAMSVSTDYEVTVVPSTSVTGAVCIKIGDNFLGNTNTKNNCKLFVAESATTAFTPTVGKDDVFTLKIAANETYHTLQYNSGSPRFAVYGGTQKNVVIYKKVAGAEVPATAIALNATTWTAEQYKYTQLTATLTPAEATTKVVWTSSDENVATVVNGNVTAVGVGTATITATAGEGVEATCAVTVTAPTILTCDSAANLALSVSADKEVVANGKFVVRGYVIKFVGTPSEDFTKWGNYSFWMADTKDATEGTFEAYQVAPKDGETIVEVGDYVEVVGDLTKYGDIPETVGKGNATVAKLATPITAIDNTTLSTPSVKTIENGQLVILRDGVKY